MTSYDYDFLAIGSGAAGSSAVTTIDTHRYRVAMVEKGQLGGTCLNYGCDPTKTLLHIARDYYTTLHDSRFGLHVSDARFDWSEVQAFVHDVIHRLRGGSIEEARAGLEKQGIHLLEGGASFVSPHEVQVGGKTISAERILIATGSETLVPPVEGLQETGYITNIQAVSLPELPRRLAIVGGGAIGIEFAQMFSRFGCQVTVLERSSMILDKEDRELADTLCDLLAKEGLRLETSAELKQARLDGGAKKLTIKCGERNEEELAVDEILMAVGRKAVYESLHLEHAGVKTTKKGVEVDATLRTSVPHIWAAGDVASPYQFTHIASAQGELVAHNAFSDNPQSFDDHAISWVTFTDPPLAHLGKTEQELQEQGVRYRVARMSFDQNERAITMGKTEGMVKLLLDERDRLLGAHVLAERGDDLLAPLILAMHAQLPINALASSLMPYPTLSETIAKVAGKQE